MPDSQKPVRREKNTHLTVLNARVAREALVWGMEVGEHPAVFLVPYAEKLKKMALEGDLDSSVTLAAIREVFDLYLGQGKHREVHVEGRDNSGMGEEVTKELLGTINRLLDRLPHEEKEVNVIDATGKTPKRL